MFLLLAGDCRELLGCRSRKVSNMRMMKVTKATHAKNGRTPAQVMLHKRVKLERRTRDIDIANLSVRLSVTFRYQMKTA